MHKVVLNHPRQSGKNTVRPSRYPVVDAVRGTAIALMFVYHFMFDLHYYHVVEIDFNNDPFWLGLRTLIVSLFLGVMGVSLHLATMHGFKRQAFGQRLLKVAGCAVLVSVASYIMFPDSMIFFGILHFIATASVLGILFYRWFWVNLVLGAGLIILGLTFQHAWFDQPGWQWIGLMTHKPVTEDYVPLLPWFGVVLLGLFLGKWLFPRSTVVALDKTGAQSSQWHEKNRFSRLLVFGGKHSLPIYMLHQPMFLAILYLVFGK